MSTPAQFYPPRRRRSLVGPLILIIIGVVFLLRNLGVPVPVFEVFARWWPVLLILAGVIKIVEHYAAMRTGEPSPRLGGGTVFFLVLVAIFGTAASAAFTHRNDINWQGMRDEMDVDDSFMHIFGNNYNYDGETQQVLSPNTSLKVLSDRGAVTVTTWDQPNLKVTWHKKIFASNQNEADNTNNSTNPQFSVAGAFVTLNANTQAAGPKGITTDIEIFAPKKLAVEVYSHRGDVNVVQRDGDVKVDLSRGDVTTEDINGNVTADLRKGTFHASRVTGNVNTTGRLSEISLIDVGGSAVVSGDVFGDIRVSKIGKLLKFSTSRTTLEASRLDGDMSMDSGELTMSQAVGPVLVTTRAKDIRLDGVSGDVKLNNDAGEMTVDVGPKQPIGNITIDGRHGDVRVHLPEKAQFAVSASTRHGEASTTFTGLHVENPDKGDSRVNGQIGSSTSKISIRTDSGDIVIDDKGGQTKTDVPSPPSTESTPAPPATPATKAPKTLKAPKTTPAPTSPSAPKTESKSETGSAQTI